MKSLFFYVSVCLLVLSCSPHVVEPARETSEWKAQSSNLFTEMTLLGYNLDNVRSNIDEFYKLNPNCFSIAKSDNGANASNSEEGWRLIRSTKSGLTYSYSFEAGDTITLPILKLKMYGHNGS